MCKIHENHKFSSVELKGNYGLFQFSVGVRGFHAFGVSQLCKRLVGEEKNYDYSNIRIVLLKSENSSSFKNIKYVVSKLRYTRDSYIEFDYFAPGTYFLFVEVDWKDENSKSIA